MEARFFGSSSKRCSQAMTVSMKGLAASSRSSSRWTASLSLAMRSAWSRSKAGGCASPPGIELLDEPLDLGRVQFGQVRFLKTVQLPGRIVAGPGAAGDNDAAGLERPQGKKPPRCRAQSGAAVVVRHLIQAVEKDDGPAGGERRFERIGAFLKWGGFELLNDVIREVLAAVHGGKCRRQAGGKLAQFDEDGDQVCFLLGQSFKCSSQCASGSRPHWARQRLKNLRRVDFPGSGQADQDEPWLERKLLQRRHFIGHRLSGCRLFHPPVRATFGLGLRIQVNIDSSQFSFALGFELRTRPAKAAEADLEEFADQVLPVWFEGVAASDARKAGSGGRIQRSRNAFQTAKRGSSVPLRAADGACRSSSSSTHCSLVLARGKRRRKPWSSACQKV